MSTALAPAILHNRREQWLMERAERVTATDAADIVCHSIGEDYYRAPAEILAAKWGISDDIKESEPMKWGRRLQAVMGEVYTEETGRPAIAVPEYTSWRHPEVPWISASGDFETIINGQSAPLEIKTDGVNWKESVPFRHLVQTQIQMGCKPAPVSAIAAFVSRYSPILHRDTAIDRDFVADCMPLLDEFYFYLRTKTMPTDPKWYTKAATRAFWPTANGQSVRFNEDDLLIVNRWERLKAFIKWGEQAKDEAETALAVRLGDNASGLFPDGSRFEITRTPIDAQLCPHGSVIKNAHTRATAYRKWPSHLKRAKNALSTKKR